MIYAVCRVCLWLFISVFDRQFLYQCMSLRNDNDGFTRSGTGVRSSQSQGAWHPIPASNQLVSTLILYRLPYIHLGQIPWERAKVEEEASSAKQPNAKQISKKACGLVAIHEAFNKRIMLNRNEAKSEAVHKKITEWLIFDNQPFSVTEGSEYCQLMCYMEPQYEVSRGRVLFHSLQCSRAKGLSLVKCLQCFFSMAGFMPVALQSSTVYIKTAFVLQHGCWDNRIWPVDRWHLA